jgi:Glycosyl hydrolase family 9
LLWGAAWLYIATRKPQYYKFVTEEAITSTAAEFSWDLKFAGAQLLLAEVYSIFKSLTIIFPPTSFLQFKHHLNLFLYVMHVDALDWGTWCPELQATNRLLCLFCVTWFCVPTSLYDSRSELVLIFCQFSYRNYNFHMN